MMEAVKEKVELQRYPEYKDTGVEWLGKLPSHWKIEKGKWLFKEEDRPTRAEDEVVTCFRDGEVTLRANRRTDGFTNSLKEHGYQGIRKGDLVIHNMDAFAGAIGVSDSDGKSTPVYSACTPLNENEVSPEFYAYFLRDLALSGFIESLAKGIRERSTDFRFSNFGELLLAMPTYEEQTAIATFLDRKTEQIDQAIEIKQKQIELLKERRQILIHKAVTRGLNPEAPLKTSGVDWIGDIPKHWEVKQLRFLFKFLNPRRIPLSAVEREEMKGDYPYYGASGVIDYIDDYLFDEPTILIAEDGANLLNKSTPLAFEARGKYWVNNHAHILKPLIEGFTFWAELLSCMDYTIYISGAAQPKLTKDNLAGIKLPVPPKDEIPEIIDYIKKFDEPISEEIKQTKLQIEKLKEYKTTLINSAVTGKIKVS